MKAAVAVRQAKPSDLAAVERWDEEPHVIASDPNDDWNWEVELGREVPWREQLIIEVDGRPIGFIQIIDPADEDSHYWGDCGPHLRAIDIWIGEADCLGRGYGTVAMRLAIARGFAAADVAAILIDPLWENDDARHFYERLGFCLIERRRFGLDDCAVYRLERARWSTD
jgi:aminoglycoside 6'-N-acetyltransferase